MSEWLGQWHVRLRNIDDLDSNLDRFSDILHYRLHTGSVAEPAPQLVRFPLGMRTGMRCGHSFPSSTKFKKRGTLPPHLMCPNVPASKYGDNFNFKKFLKENTLTCCMGHTVTVYGFIPIRHSLNLKTFVQLPSFSRRGMLVGQTSGLWSYGVWYTHRRPRRHIPTDRS